MTRTTLTLPFLALLAASPVFGQSELELPRPSPRAQVMQRVGLTDITVTYSSPGVKGRQVWDDLVPYGELWRTGANRATTVEFSRDVKVAGQPVPAGIYALYTTPGRSEWTVVLNTNHDTGGTNGYDAKNDVATISVKPTAAPRRERMTFLFSDTTSEFTRLDLEWDELRVSIPIAADTQSQVARGIDAAVANAWRPQARAAGYLLDQGRELSKALELVEGSIAIDETWYNLWVKAQILAKMNKTRDAKRLTKKALAKGDDSGAFAFYAEQMKSALADWK